MNNTDKIILWVVVALLAVSGGFGWYKYYADSKKEDVTIGVDVTLTPTITVIPTTIPSVTPTPTIVPLVDEGVTWIKPKKMKDLKLFGEDSGSIDYYQVANLLNDGKLIDAFTCELGCSVFRFKYAGGKYYWLTNHSATTGGDGFAHKVVYDSETAYSGITTPSTMQGSDQVRYLGGGAYYSGNDIFYSSLENPIEVTTTSYGKIYRTNENLRSGYSETTSKIIDGVYVRRLYLKSADTTIPSYSIGSGILKDDGTADFRLTDGKKNTDVYIDMFGISCGSSKGQTIIKSDASMVSDLVVIGTTSNGEKIYSIKNKNNAFLKYAYDNYESSQPKNRAVSLSTFAANRSIIAFKDKLGDYSVFLNEKYQPMAECGKPVIYLYPKKGTNVTVKVGADITKSEPVYGTGWTAYAKPSGKLKIGGINYPYLFWEGTGWGEYPQITQGTIVKTKNVKSTLIKQMKILGLNGGERADFLEFWLPKMPKNKYVRLTWFDTAQMNELAPLLVSPKPETMIRVFLDFQGMDKKVDITPQKLSKLKRRGFTLVEWGGLLIK